MSRDLIRTELRQQLAKVFGSPTTKVSSLMSLTGHSWRQLCIFYTNLGASYKMMRMCKTTSTTAAAGGGFWILNNYVIKQNSSKFNYLMRSSIKVCSILFGTETWTVFLSFRVAAGDCESSSQDMPALRLSLLVMVPRLGHLERWCLTLCYFTQLYLVEHKLPNF